MLRAAALRVVTTIFLLFALLTTAAQAAPREEVQAFAIEVPDLGRLALVGRDPQSAIFAYVEGLIRDQVFPGEAKALRSWGRELAVRSANAPTLAALRAASGKPLSGIQLNNLHDLVGSAEQKAGRRLFSQGMRPTGMQAVYLPPAITTRNIEPLLKGLSHLLLTGGDDTHPGLNGEAVTHSHPDELNLLRDRREAAVARKAVALGMPVDSVCRGFQLLNRVWGGSVTQDIHLDGLTQVPHSAPGFKPTPLGVKVEPGSALASAGGTSIRNAPFMHHQALGRIAPGFRVTGRTADGIAAAFEGFGGQVRGTQFHFEHSLRSGYSKAIFAAMAGRARAYEGSHARR